MNHYIIVAAGSGSRYGGTLPKQFCDLNGRPLLMTTLERLHACSPDWSLTVVLSNDMTDMWQRMCSDHDFTLPHSVAIGGATRAESVRNALMTLGNNTDGYIGVHDAARPIVTSQLIGAIMTAMADGEADGVIPACDLTDSIRSIDPDGTSTAADRTRFRAVQTPQVFPASKLIEANRRLDGLGPDEMKAFTDDASVMEAAGFSRLRLSQGDPRNIKVTKPGDMDIAELYLSKLPF